MKEQEIGKFPSGKLPGGGRPPDPLPPGPPGLGGRSPHREFPRRKLIKFSFLLGLCRLSLSDNKEADNLAKRASKGETLLHWHCRSPDARYLWVQVGRIIYVQMLQALLWCLWARRDLPSPVWVEAEWEVVACISLHVAVSH